MCDHPLSLSLSLSLSRFARWLQWVIQNDGKRASIYAGGNPVLTMLVGLIMFCLSLDLQRQVITRPLLFLISRDP